VTALAKLSVRIGPNVQSRIQSILQSLQSSLNLDLQQRSCEYSQFWNWDEEKRVAVLKRIPPLAPKADSTVTTQVRGNVAAINSANSISNQFPTGGGGNTSLIGNLLGPLDPVQTSGFSGVDPSLLTLLGPTGTGGGTAPLSMDGSASANVILNLFGPSNHLATPPSGLGLGGLGVTPLGLPSLVPTTPGPFGMPIPVGIPPLMPGGGVPTAPVIPSDSQYPSIIAFSNTELTCTFHFKKPNPQQLQYTLITSVFSSLHPTPITDLNFQAAPPKHIKYVLEHPSGKDMAGPGHTITQAIKAANSAQGEKPLMMKMRIIYNVDGQKRDIEHVCKNFPPNL